MMKSFMYERNTSDNLVREAELVRSDANRGLCESDEKKRLERIKAALLSPNYPANSTLGGVVGSHLNYSKVSLNKEPQQENLEEKSRLERLKAALLRPPTPMFQNNILSTPDLKKRNSLIPPPDMSQSASSFIRRRSPISNNDCYDHQEFQEAVESIKAERINAERIKARKDELLIPPKHMSNFCMDSDERAERINAERIKARKDELLLPPKHMSNLCMDSDERKGFLDEMRPRHYFKVISPEILNLKYTQHTPYIFKTINVNNPSLNFEQTVSKPEDDHKLNAAKIFEYDTKPSCFNQDQIRDSFTRMLLEYNCKYPNNDIRYEENATFDSDLEDYKCENEVKKENGKQQSQKSMIYEDSSSESTCSAIILPLLPHNSWKDFWAQSNGVKSSCSDKVERIKGSTAEQVVLSTNDKVELNTNKSRTSCNIQFKGTLDPTNSKHKTYEINRNYNKRGKDSRNQNKKHEGYVSDNWRHTVSGSNKYYDKSSAESVQHAIILNPIESRKSSKDSRYQIKIEEYVAENSRHRQPEINRYFKSSTESIQPAIILKPLESDKSRKDSRYQIQLEEYVAENSRNRMFERNRYFDKSSGESVQTAIILNPIESRKKGKDSRTESYYEEYFAANSSQRESQNNRYDDMLSTECSQPAIILKQIESGKKGKDSRTESYNEEYFAANSSQRESQNNKYYDMFSTECSQPAIILKPIESGKKGKDSRTQRYYEEYFAANSSQRESQNNRYYDMFSTECSQPAIILKPIESGKRGKDSRYQSKQNEYVAENSRNRMPIMNRYFKSSTESIQPGLILKPIESVKKGNDSRTQSKRNEYVAENSIQRESERNKYYVKSSAGSFQPAIILHSFEADKKDKDGVDQRKHEEYDQLEGREKHGNHCWQVSSNSTVSIQLVDSTHNIHQSKKSTKTNLLHTKDSKSSENSTLRLNQKSRKSMTHRIFDEACDWKDENCKFSIVISYDNCFNLNNGFPLVQKGNSSLTNKKLRTLFSKTYKRQSHDHCLDAYHKMPLDQNKNCSNKIKKVRTLFSRTVERPPRLKKSCVLKNDSDFAIVISEDHEFVEDSTSTMICGNDSFIDKTVKPLCHYKIDKRHSRPKKRYVLQDQNSEFAIVISEEEYGLDQYNYSQSDRDNDSFSDTKVPIILQPRTASRKLKTHKHGDNKRRPKKWYYLCPTP